MNSANPVVAKDHGTLSDSWLGTADLRLIAGAVGTPVFIYSEAQLLKNVNRINDAARDAGLDDRVKLYIPFFPNSNPHVLRSLQDAGVGLLLQLPSEHQILSQFNFSNFIVSPGYISDQEIDYWIKAGYPTFLSSLDEVSYALRNNAPSISVRIDGLDSGKPGIKLAELSSLSALLDHYDRTLECFEVYAGSGNSQDEMTSMIETLFTIFKKHFPTARSLNFAGGHGFVYEEWAESAKHFDWHQYLNMLQKIAEQMQIPRHVKFLFEPARDVLADIGALLLRVKRNVITNPVSSLVVTDGSRMLMPSAQLRDRRHNVAFLDRSMTEIAAATAPGGTQAALRGRSILRHDYILPGDYWVPDGVDGQSYVAILDVGAYCATQHMEFLNIPPSAEVMVDTEGSVQLITARGDELDKWRYLLTKPREVRPASTGTRGKE
jgi:diaminopimelate decarboxylase